jgi:hypothetical protein
MDKNFNSELQMTILHNTVNHKKTKCSKYLSEIINNFDIFEIIYRYLYFEADIKDNKIIKKGLYSIIKDSEKYNITNNSYYKNIDLAIEYNQLEIVKFYLQNGESLDKLNYANYYKISFKPNSKYFYPIINDICEYGYLEMLKYFHINGYYGDERSIINSIKYDNIKILEYLLTVDMYINYFKNNILIHIKTAINCNNLNMFKFMVNNYILKYNSNNKEKAKKILLNLVPLIIKKDKYDILLYIFNILESYNKNKNIKGNIKENNIKDLIYNCEKNNNLINEAIKNKNIKMITYLIFLGFKTNEFSLHRALQTFDIKIINAICLLRYNKNNNIYLKIIKLNDEILKILSILKKYNIDINIKITNKNKEF